MIIEDYVNFETAKLLKEKGFDGDTNRYYIEGSVDKNPYYSPIRQNHNKRITNNEFDIDITSSRISAPTLQMTMKWLRENHNLHIIVTPEYGDVEYMPGEWQEEFLGWKYTIISVNGTTTTVHPTVYAKTAESAYEAGIEYCIKYAI